MRSAELVRGNFPTTAMPVHRRTIANLIIGLTFLVLAIPASAIATTEYQGADDSGPLRFTAHFVVEGDQVVSGEWQWGDVLFSCYQGPEPGGDVTADFGVDSSNPLTIANGRFSGQQSSHWYDPNDFSVKANLTTRLEGEIDGPNATGTISVDITYTDGSEGCTYGPYTWTASDPDFVDGPCKISAKSKQKATPKGLSFVLKSPETKSCTASLIEGTAAINEKTLSFGKPGAEFRVPAGERAEFNVRFGKATLKKIRKGLERNFIVTAGAQFNLDGAKRYVSAVLK